MRLCKINRKEEDYLVKGGLKFEDFTPEIAGIHFEDACILWELIIIVGLK